MRYLRSDKDRDITMRLESHLWAGKISLKVWVNGQRAYDGVITGEPDRTAKVTAHLKQGWNTLFFKSTHQTYFWQQTISLLPVAGDSLDELVVSLAKP